MFSESLLAEIRDRFHHVDRCPYQGARIFFENAGGSLTLKSVVEVNTMLSAIPDNQGRDNPASRELVRIIQQGRRDMLTFLGTGEGLVFVGESGTECLFRVIRAALLGAVASGGQHARVLGSTLEHPATASAAKQWSVRVGAEYVAIPHDSRTGAVGVDEYRRHVTPDTRVATLIQTSPVTGMSVDVKAVTAAIREVSPDCFVIVDGIQHAPHGDVNIDDYLIDAYAVSAYKVFSRHNYGFAWLSPRLSVMPHDKLEGTADDVWELGTRDTAAYATFSAVVEYFDWLGARVFPELAPEQVDSEQVDSKQVDSNNRRERITAAAKAIAAHEKHLVDVMLNGGGGRKGLADMPEVFLIGGCNNDKREGLVSLAVQGVPSARVVSELSAHGVRVHIRKNDYFSGNILTPLNLETCVRVSMCHYNTVDEVAHFLKAMEAIIAGS